MFIGELAMEKTVCRENWTPNPFHQLLSQEMVSIKHQAGFMFRQIHILLVADSLDNTSLHVTGPEVHTETTNLLVGKHVFVLVLGIRLF